MSESVRDVSELTGEVVTEVEQVIVGKQALLREIMTTILADGHILLEDFPGLAKTLIAQSFAVALGLDFKRIQFTPDLLPGDITGSYVYDRNSGSFELRRGPIFANIVLADEINRASPKTQSALLEAMSQGQVTLEGETMPLPSPFIVIATQNPIEYEGTFPLPEAQLDRFLVKLAVGYPSVDEEQEILKRRQQRRSDEMSVRPMISAEKLLGMRESIEDVHIDPDLERYIVELVHQTRVDSRVAVGASPRGSLALLKLSRAYAAIDGRDYVLPDDVKHFAKPALLHRLILNPELWLRRNAPDQVLSGIINNVPVPMIEGV